MHVIRDAEPRERPILFAGPMVRALHAGTKSQTRRVIKPQPGPRTTEAFRGADGVWRFSYPTARAPVSDGEWDARCPYGAPGERLWVREAWAPEQYDTSATTIAELETSVRKPAYRADFRGEPAYKWRPSIHMPRKASRILLEVTDVRVERLQDISEADAIAEGILELVPAANRGGGAHRRRAGARRHDDGRPHAPSIASLVPARRPGRRAGVRGVSLASVGSATDQVDARSLAPTGVRTALGEHQRPRLVGRQSVGLGSLVREE